MDSGGTLTLTLTVVAAGLSAYVGAYAKRKGENLATKEDLAAVVEQTRLLTETTKRIEATVSHELWNRQRQWELKRDHLLSALEPLGRIDGIVMRLDATTRGLQEGDADSSFFRARRTEAENEWHAQMELFDSRRRLLLVVCSRRTSEEFREVAMTLRRLIKPAFRVEPLNLRDLGKRFEATRDRAFSAARDELGLEPLGLKPERGSPGSDLG